MKNLPARRPKKGPSHCPLENFPEVIETRSHGGVSLFLIKTTLLLPEGTHAHADYEFLLSLSPMPAQVEKRKIGAQPQKLLPINPGQVHGNPGHPGRYRFLSIEIEQDFLLGNARSMGAKEDIFFQNEYLQVKNDLQNLLQLFIEEAQNQLAGCEFVLGSLAAQLTVNLLRQAKTNLPVLPSGHNYTEKENINRVIAFLKEQYNDDYSLAEVARLAHLSLYHFIRVFKAQTGKTPYEYLLDVKIEKARELLRFGKYTVTEISGRCGFKNSAHFATAFKRKTGVSPSEYRAAFLGKELNKISRKRGNRPKRRRKARPKGSRAMLVQGQRLFCVGEKITRSEKKTAR